MAESIGRPVAELIGTSARQLIDPGNRHSVMSEGTRALFAALDGGEAFQEIAFPAVTGKRWYCMSGRPVRDEWGVIMGWRGVASDITLQRAGEGTDSIKMARRDPLTGLANRLLVREMIEEARLRQIAGNGQCVLLLLDLDRFKLVNDTLGHAVGDLLLVEVARRISAVCGRDAGVARLGGDEFAVVWRGAADTLTLVTLAEELVATISEGFVIGSTPIHVGVSVGIARAPLDGDTQDQLMRSADLALYRAKELGRGCSAFYEPWMLAKAQANRLLENDVREAVRRGELHLTYQPILNAASMDVVGHEALLRWSHPQRGSISPDVFIPIIEDVGLIHQIGDWVIREACRQAATWPDDLRVAVNVSVAQLTAVGLRETVEDALRDSGLAPHRLELEVTESVFMGDDAATLAALSRLHELGVRLVLDDFGKGYSSFGYLSRSCFAKIKIDQLFVRAAANGQRESMAIVGSILALAKGLGVETTAEGIETPAQAELMAHLGCSQLQGFLFGRAVSAEAVRLAQHRPINAPEPVLRRA
jgi:diguanylate cyclase (GGDEF)-like protein